MKLEDIEKAGKLAARLNHLAEICVEAKGAVKLANAAVMFDIPQKDVFTSAPSMSSKRVGIDSDFIIEAINGQMTRLRQQIAALGIQVGGA